MPNIISSSAHAGECKVKRQNCWLISFENTGRHRWQYQLLMLETGRIWLIYTIFFSSFENDWVIASPVESIKSICTLPKNQTKKESKGLYPWPTWRNVGMQGRDGGTFDVWRCQQLRKVSTFICLLQLHCPFIEGNACPVFSAWLFLTHAQPKPTKIKCSPPLFHIKIDSSLWKHRQLWWCCKLFLPRWVFLRKWK